MGVWRQFEADGMAWEVRALSGAEMGEDGGEILEFRTTEGQRQPRRTPLRGESLTAMDDRALLAAYRRALPIGGDFYGRPGKHMEDVQENQTQGAGGTKP